MKHDALAGIQNLIEPTLLNEVKMGKLLSWEKPGADKDRSLLYREKVRREVIDTALGVQAQQRERKCWMHTLGCKGTAYRWIFDVGFDRKVLGATLDFAQIDTLGYEGPNPGFCIGHLNEGPAMLAEKIYWNQTLVKWGYLPTRWYARFTDGSSTRGPIRQINPKMLQPDVLTSSH